MARLKEYEAHITRKDYLIRTSISAGSTPCSKPTLATDQTKILQDFLDRVEAGRTPLELNDRGLITTLRSRPGTVVFTPEQLEALRALTGGSRGAAQGGAAGPAQKAL
jgi:hypothetical protein